MDTNQTVGCRGKNAFYLIAVIIAALFCFGGCSNENTMKQSTVKPPLTEEVIEQTLEENGDTWKQLELDIDAETAARAITNDYWYEDSDGYRLLIGTYKKEGATYLNISCSPRSNTIWKESRFFNEKLPDVFAAACELYGDGVGLKDFEGFWDFYKSKKGLDWRKVVGDNVIYVQLPKKDFMSYPMVFVTIQKKSWVDWSSIITIKSILWENQDVSIEEHISKVGDITENKAVPIKSCYIVNGEVVATKKLAETSNLPDEKGIFKKAHRSYSIQKTGEYNVATIEDSSGKIEVIIPSQISESEFKEFKYFLVYEYTTDKGRAFYLLAATRTLNVPVL